MRILHVITSLNTGGAEHLMVDLLPRLRDLENIVELAVFCSQKTDFWRQLEGTGIKIHGFSETESVYNPKHIFRLVKLLRKFDIVHTHNTACQFFTAIVSKRNIKLVTTEHSTSTRRRNYKFFRYIDRWMYSRYDKIICIAEPSEQSLRNHVGDSYPIITIHNGIDVERFKNAEEMELGIPNCRIITMVAGFRYEKDQPTVIKSLKYLPDNYHLLLVGDGERRQEFEELIKDLELADRVHLLGLRKDVPNILKSSDVIVMSSHREGLSLSNVEGMASGKPFVASDVEGLREVTRGFGVLFPHGDAETLANIIIKLNTDDIYRHEIIKRCIERSCQYDISNMAEKYNMVYKQLCN